MALSKQEMQAGLGQICSEHPVETKQIVWGAILGAFLSGVFVLLGAAFIYHRRGELGLTLALLSSFGLPGMFLLWQCRRHARSCIVIGSKGLYLRLGPQEMLLDWLEIANLKTSMFNYRHCTMQLQLTNGKKIFLGALLPFFLKELNRACLQAQVCLAHAHFARADQAFNSGGELHFGRFRISQSGLQIGRKRLSWAELNRVEFWRGQICFLKKNSLLAWGREMLSDVPNWWLMCDLISFNLPQRYFAKTEYGQHFRAYREQPAQAPFSAKPKPGAGYDQYSGRSS